MSNVMTNDECTFERIYLYTRFERFWHWVQAAFVVLLGLTGYEIHTGYNLFGFKRAVEWHNFLGIAWLILYAFIIFWHLTTGQWKYYIPTTKMLLKVMLYYGSRDFQGRAAPGSQERKGQAQSSAEADVPLHFRVPDSLPDGHGVALLHVQLLAGDGDNGAEPQHDRLFAHGRRFCFARIPGGPRVHDDHRSLSDSPHQGHVFRL